jgi:hypothetical protein
MNENEEKQLVTSLVKGPAELQAALEGVTSEAATWTPGPGKWSILECVEHLASVEELLFSRMLAAEQADAPLINEGRETLIAARGSDRSRRVEAPEGSRPQGAFTNLGEALGQLLARRELTIQFVREHAREDLRSRIASHPLFGTVNCQEVLLLMAAHLFRHTLQVEEIKQAARFDC